MQSLSRTRAAKSERSERDARKSKQSSSDTHAMTDTSRAMSAAVKTVTMLHPSVPSGTAVAGQQTGFVSHSCGAGPQVSLVATNQTASFTVASAQSGFAVSSAQSTLPFVKLTSSSIGSPLIGQSASASPHTVLPNGGMLTVLGSPQARKTLSGGELHGQTQATTHYAALLPKPAGYSRVAAKQSTPTKHVSVSKPSCGKANVPETDSSRSVESHGKVSKGDKGNASETTRQRNSASSAQRGNRRTIACKRQLPPLHIQPHPASSATSLYPSAYTTVLGNASAGSNAGNTTPQSASGNFMVNAAAANTLTAILAPNMLHILPIGAAAVQQLAHLQQAVANAGTNTTSTVCTVAGTYFPIA